MIVTAALAWWNERPKDLAACVRATGNIADRIVALDGAYARYPEATVRSSKRESTAIEKAATEVGLDCLILQPNRLWAGQVEKRTYLLNVASVGSDWIVVVDTDHIIHTDREAARGVLEGSDDTVNVIEVPFYTPPHPSRSLNDSAAGVWHVDQVGKRVSIPHIYRALPGLRVEQRHWWISAIKDGRRVWLWSSAGTYPTLGHHSMPVPYEVEHRALFRTDEQIRLSRGFLNDREMVVQRTGQEDDLPGLPVPEFNYEQNQSW